MPRLTSVLTIDTREAYPEAVAEIEAILYGDENNEPRMPMPFEVAMIARRYTLFEDADDPGTFLFFRNDVMIEDEADPGTYQIVKEGLYEDPEDEGIYRNGVPK